MDTVYINMLHHLEDVVGGTLPYQFNKEAYEEAMRARNDVLCAIRELENQTPILWHDI